MKNVKKVLSLALVCAMIVALLPVVTWTTAEADTTGATGTTGLFNGNATYLLQERFNTGFTNQANGGKSNATLSGWDVDYRGGSVSSNVGVATLTDTKIFDKTSISHQLMKHTGDNLVMESQFQYVCEVRKNSQGEDVTDPLDSGFHYTMTGDGKVALDLRVKGDISGYFFYVNDVKTAITCSPNTKYSIKAVFANSSKTVDVYINGEKAATAAYKENATSIDNIEIGTTEEQVATVKLNYVYVYVNYVVNEQFMGSAITGWDITGGSVEKAPGSPYPADPNGYSLVPGDPDAVSGDSNVVNINAPFDATSEVTWVRTGVKVSEADDIGGRNNVIMATGVDDKNDNTVGVILKGNSFAFREGDTITYSIDYYSSSSTKPQVWLRNHGTNSLEPFRSDSHNINANDWNTLTKTMTYEQLLSGSSMSKNVWTDPGTYALYIRGAIGTCYLDNFKVTVTRKAPEVSYLDGVLEKKFGALSGKHSFTWNMLVPSTGVDGFKASFGGAEFTANGGKFYINGQEAYTYTNNVWYKLEIRTDGSTAELLINDVSRKSGVPASGTMESIRLGNGATSNVIVDDIQVYKTPSASDYANYPEPDEDPSSDYHLGMVVYPMWREGVHYGWDAISPYDDRTPYQGYYTNGSKEVADWDAKWMIEHGIDHAIYPFVNPKEGEQAKMSVRGEALEGYLASEYKDRLSYAIMMTNPMDENLKDADDYIANAVPYIVEHHFKNPAYKKIDNKLPVYMYNFGGFASNLGGNAQLNAVLNKLDSEAKALGYEGLLFMVDISSVKETNVEKFKSEQSENYTIYKWRYSWATDMPGSIINAIKNDASSTDKVPSVAMGFDNTPWRSNYVDMMTPEQVDSICASIPQNIGSNPKIVLFTCWDEWGEGHFWAPSTQGEFGYLNAIRKNLTSAGVKTNETRPSADSVKRMSVLYPEGRQSLKIKNDRRIYTADDMAGLAVIGTFTAPATIDVQRISTREWNWFSWGEWKVGNWTSSVASGAVVNDTSSFDITKTEGQDSKTKTETGTATDYNFVITSPEQATATWDISSMNLDLSKVSAIEINGYAENSAEMVLNFATSETTDSDWSFRFSAPNTGDTTVRDVILLPDSPGSLAGTATKMRFNPTQKTGVGSKFVVNSVTFYSGELPKTKVYIDQKETRMVSEPVEENGTTYIPAYQFLLNAGAFATWDKTTQSLTVEKDGITAVFTAGNAGAKVNGETVNYTAAPFYREGNIYIPYDAVLDPFGYDVIMDGNTINYYNKTTGMSYDTTDYLWDFEIDGNTDTWKPDDSHRTTIDTRDGFLQFRSRTGDPVMRIKDINVPKSEVNYAVIRLKKTDVKSTAIFRVYGDANCSSPSASGVCYNFTVNPSDEVQTFVFKLDEDYNTSYGAYNSITDAIQSIRFDPMDSNSSGMSTFGSIYIDSIEFTKDDPTAEPVVPQADYAIKAYGFETENLFQRDVDKNSYVFTNMNSANGLPETETVDGYQNVLKLQPIEQKDTGGIFSIEQAWYKDSKTAVKDIRADNRVIKISFWYKAIDSCGEIRFENRKGGGRDGEEFSIRNASATQWKYFENYIDLSNEAAESAWLSLRIVNGGAYIRDYSFVCLDETTELTTFGDDTIAFKIITKDGVPAANGDLYIASYDDNSILNGMQNNKVPRTFNVSNGGKSSTEESCYHFFTPRTSENSMKLFLWDNYVPLIEEPYGMTRQ